MMTGEILAAPENCYADVKTISTFFSTLSLVSGDLCCHFIYLDALSIPACLPRNDIQSFCGLSASLAASPRIDSIHKLFFKFRRYILLHSLILSFPILLQYTWALNIDTLYIDHLMRQKTIHILLQRFIGMVRTMTIIFQFQESYRVPTIRLSAPVQCNTTLQQYGKHLQIRG